MSRWRKKPVVIDAFQWFGDQRQTEHPTWIIQAIIDERATYKDGAMYIKTLEGTMKAEQGDFIIFGIKGELYPCKPDIFFATYEKVED